MDGDENRSECGTAENNFFLRTAVEMRQAWGYLVSVGILYLLSAFNGINLYRVSWQGMEWKNAMSIVYGLQALECLLLIAAFFAFRRKLRRNLCRTSGILFDLCGFLLTWLPIYQVMSSIGGIWGNSILAVGGNRPEFLFFSFAAVLFLLGGFTGRRNFTCTAILLAIVVLVLEGSGLAVQFLRCDEGSAISIGFQNKLLSEQILSSRVYDVQVIIAFSDLLMMCVGTVGLIVTGIALRNGGGQKLQRIADPGSGGKEDMSQGSIPPFSPGDDRDYR